MDLSTIRPPASATSSARALRLSQTWSYYAAFIALGLVAASLGPTLPSLAANTHTQLADISLLFTVRSFGYLIGSFQSGSLYDRRGGHPIMIVALLSMAVMLALVPFITLLWLLIGVFLIIGIAEGTIDVGGNTLLLWVHQKQVGPFMNGLHFCFGFGAFLAPLIVAQLILLSGVDLAGYWAIAVLLVPAIIMLLRLPGPVPQREATQDSLDAPVDYRLVVLIAVVFVLYVGTEVSFGGWVFSYAVALNLTDAASAAYLTSAFWGALTLGRLLAVPLAARLRPRTLVLIDMIGCLLCIGSIVVWSNSLTVLWVATIGTGVAMASIFPTLLSFATHRMTVTGQVTRWFFVGTSIGAMSVPWLVGQLFTAIGPKVTMLAILIDVVAEIVLFVGLLAYTGRRVTMEAHV